MNQKYVLVVGKLDTVLNSSSASVILACLTFPFFNAQFSLSRLVQKMHFVLT